MKFGYFLICLGVLFLLHNFGYVHGGPWRFIIALFLLFAGGSMIKKSIGSKEPSREND